MMKWTFVARLLVSANGRDEGSLFEMTLSYDPERSPLAVSATFPTENGKTVWMFARDLLARGSQSEEPYGEGDVRLCREGATVRLCLDSPDGHADIAMPWGAVKVFLENTYDLVRSGEEDVWGDLDAFLREVLES